jgi:imidazolonepropionase-like amidohydrolase
MDRSRILFRDVRVFDGSGAPLFPGDVLVDGKAIDAVVPRGTRLQVDDALVVEGAGATLMPGLVEAHAHLSWPSSVGNIINAMRMPAEEHLLTTALNARVTLDHGYTSAFSAGSQGQRFEIALRNEIDAGHLPGPRLRAATIENAPSGSKSGVPGAHGGVEGSGVDALRAYVRQMAEMGADTIKFLLSSDDAFEPGGSLKVLFSEEEVRAIGETARECDIWLACHAQAAPAVKLAVRNGFRLINHCTHADEEALDLLDEHKGELFVAPAAGLLYSRVHEAQSFGIDHARAAQMGAVSGLEAMQRLYPEMRRRGIRVLPGGDYGFPYNPIGRNARDLQLFVDLFGFTPAETLVAATKLGGQLMDMPVGEVRAGCWADLLLVDGDPLADLRILQDKDRLLAIMKDGKFHKAPTGAH